MIPKELIPFINQELPDNHFLKEGSEKTIDVTSIFFDERNKFAELKTNIICTLMNTHKYSMMNGIQIFDEYNRFIKLVSTNINLSVCKLPIFRFNDKTRSVSSMEFESFDELLIFLNSIKNLTTIYNLCINEGRNSYVLRFVELANHGWEI